MVSRTNCILRPGKAVVRVTLWLHGHHLAAERLRVRLLRGRCEFGRCWRLWRSSGMIGAPSLPPPPPWCTPFAIGRLRRTWGPRRLAELRLRQGQLVALGRTLSPFRSDAKLRRQTVRQHWLETEVRFWEAVWRYKG
eukprot:COSAG06_NODE_37899_length_429_cov_12.596970_1_plen_136_part_01